MSQEEQTLGRGDRGGVCETRHHGKRVRGPSSGAPNAANLAYHRGAAGAKARICAARRAAGSCSASKPATRVKDSSSL